MRHLFAFLIPILLLSASAIQAEEGKLTNADIPQAVLEAFAKANPGVVATEFGKETIDGKLRYEIETKAGDKEKDFVYSPDGTLLQTEEDIDVADLPKPVIESVKKAHPDGKIDEADKITRGSTVEFEIGLEIGESDYELIIKPDGTIISSKLTADDEGEAGDNDDADEEDED